MTVNKNIVSDTIAHYGKEEELNVCMEESAELIQAISKVRRYGTDRLEGLIEEMADTIICIETLKQILGIEEYDLQKAIEQKQIRTQRRVRNEQRGNCCNNSSNQS